MYHKILEKEQQNRQKKKARKEELRGKDQS